MMQKKYPGLPFGIVLCLGGLASAGVLANGFVAKRVGQGLSDPTALVFDAGGTGYAAERNGRIYSIRNDTLSPQPLIALAADTTGERGLLGMALDPAFATNHRLYLAYFTLPAASSHMQLVSYVVEADHVDPAKETVILVLPNTRSATANLGGGLACGTDGKLYLGVGDYKQPELAQDLASPNGKILRVNANGFIPNDNPFYATGTGQGKAAWALGFGNPVGLDFQAASGALYVNDAPAGGTPGGDFQEVDIASAGGNFGWPTVSGPSADARFKGPLSAYPSTEGCAIRGGDFQPAGIGDFPAGSAGDYYAADLCGGGIRRLQPITGEKKDFLTGLGRPAAIRFGPNGELYYLTQGAGSPARPEGEAYKVSYSPDLAIHILSEPEDATLLEGGTPTFKVTAQGPGTLAYQWHRDGKDISGAVAASLTLASAISADNGSRFSVSVSNGNAKVESRVAVLTVTKNPIVVPKVVTQPADMSARPGQSATFSVEAEGTGPLHYQWNRKGVPISGATNSSYRIGTVTASENGVDFFVEVSNGGGLVTSRRALLNVPAYGVTQMGDVHPSAASNGRGNAEADMSNGESDPGDGDMLSIGDKLYQRGIGTYANSELAYNLSAACDSFSAEVGVDGERGSTGTVVFEVFADGISLFRSNVMTAASPPAKIVLGITGKSLLVLRVTDAGDKSGNDYADWADARMKCWDNFSAPVVRPKEAHAPPGRAGNSVRIDLGGKGIHMPIAQDAGAGSAWHIFDMQGRLIQTTSSQSEGKP